MKKTIDLETFAKELRERLNQDKTVDCCKEELLNLADIIEKKLPQEKIEVTWKD